MFEPKVGRPIEPLSKEKEASFIYWVGEDLLLTNASRHIGITPKRLKNIMDRGEDDINQLQDESTEFAQFYIAVRKKQAEKISKLLHQIEMCPKNWQALAWKLEKCFREDFGQEAEMYKDLLDSYKKLFESYKQLLESKTSQRIVDDGREMDSKGD